MRLSKALLQEKYNNKLIKAQKNHKKKRSNKFVRIKTIKTKKPRQLKPKRKHKIR